MFYLAQWEEQHTGVMITNFMGVFGTTEVQWSLILLCFANYFSGWWISGTSIADLIPVASALPAGLGARSLSWVFGVGYFIGTCL